MATDSKKKPSGEKKTDPGQKKTKPGDAEIIQVYENAPESYDGTCLRPLGLCELGGCCDTCWYRPDHPRHQQK